MFLKRLFRRKKDIEITHDELAWLGSTNPLQLFQENLEAMLKKQVSGTNIINIKFYTPNHLISVDDSEKKSDQILIIHAGISTSFEAQIISPPSTIEKSLSGVFTWIATNISGRQRQDTTYLDLTADAIKAEEQLNERMLELIKLNTNYKK